MKNRLYAAIAVVLVAGVPVASALAEGPRPSSYNNWPGMMDNSGPANVPSAYPVQQPRASSLATWPRMTYNAMLSPSPFDRPRPSPAH